MLPTDQIPLKIAIADDHLILATAIAAMLDADTHFSVLAVVRNGKQLITKLKQFNTILPDVCLIDINMPEMNGYETAATLSKEFPSIKTIVLSMYSNDFTVMRMIKAGVLGYILKDCTPGELKNALNEVAAGRFYVSRSIHHAAFSATKHPITENEERFLKLCCSELTYEDIAREMRISTRTVHGYRDRLFERLQINNRIGLALYAKECGLA